VIVICFSIADPESFQHIPDFWIHECAHYSPKTPILLVGCKEDLRHGGEQGKERKERKENGEEDPKFVSREKVTSQRFP